ncbi:MAG TPA: HAD family hydrolase [Longimicrobiales bacterium]|nr:HAD family hydrolase [Longimicrobiales bacterium]
MTPHLRPAVFVDRDGTLIAERDYLADAAGVSLVPGAVEALASLRAAGFALVVVTNQSGIARGLYRLEDYHAVAARLDGVLGLAGVPVDGTWFCPHHPDYTGPCACRKPGVGMYVQAAGELGLDLQASWYVGDKITDVLPALELGGRGILVRSGYGRDLEAAAPGPVSVVDDLPAAARLIVARAGGPAGR